MKELKTVFVDPTLLRERLAKILAKTRSGDQLNPLGWWVGDTAGERQVMDDVSSGRAFWSSAFHNAEYGLQALDAGDIDAAYLRAWAATDFYVAALEKRVRRSDMSVLDKSARRRGRPPKTIGTEKK